MLGHSRSGAKSFSWDSPSAPSSIILSASLSRFIFISGITTFLSRLAILVITSSEDGRVDFAVMGSAGIKTGSTGWPNFLSKTDADWIPRGIEDRTTARLGNRGSSPRGLSCSRVSLFIGITLKINFALSAESGIMCSLRQKPSMPKVSRPSQSRRFPALFLNRPRACQLNQ